MKLFPDLGFWFFFGIRNLRSRTGWDCRVVTRPAKIISWPPCRIYRALWDCFLSSLHPTLSSARYWTTDKKEPGILVDYWAMSYLGVVIFLLSPHWGFSKNVFEANAFQSDLNFFRAAANDVCGDPECNLVCSSGQVCQQGKPWLSTLPVIMKSLQVLCQTKISTKFIR